MVDEDEIPEIFRKEVIEWDREIQRLGELLTGLLCEGLGDMLGRKSDDGGELLPALPTA